jgi:hypothetical protein
MQFVDILIIELQALSAKRRAYFLESIAESIKSKYWNDINIYLMTDHELSKIPLFDNNTTRQKTYFETIQKLSNQIQEVEELISKEEESEIPKMISVPFNSNPDFSLPSVIYIMTDWFINPNKSWRSMSEWNPEILTFTVEYQCMKYESSRSLRKLANLWINTYNNQIDQ